MKIVFFIIVTIMFLIVLLFTPVRLSGVFHINFLTREMFFSVKNFLFKIISAKVYLLPDYEISFIQKTNIMFRKEIPKTKKDVMMIELLKRTKIVSLDLIIDGGKENDAFFTAMAIGSTYALINTVCVMAHDSIEKANIKINPAYAHDKFIISARSTVGVRIISLIIAILKSKTAFKNRNKIQYAK